MAEKAVPKRFSNYFKTTDVDGSKLFIPYGFWKVVRSMVKYMSTRVEWGMDVTGASPTTVSVGQGGCYQNRYYRYSTGAAAVTVSWSGAASGKTVVYVPYGTGNVISVGDFAATLSTAVPTTALILAYVDTRSTAGHTLGGTYSPIDVNVRPTLFEQTKPFIYWA